MNLEHIFKYHAPDEEQRVKYNNIREGAKAFAEVVIANCPAGPDQSVAIRKIREATMTANAAVALNGLL